MLLHFACVGGSEDAGLRCTPGLNKFSGDGSRKEFVAGHPCHYDHESLAQHVSRMQGALVALEGEPARIFTVHISPAPPLNVAPPVPSYALRAERALLGGLACEWRGVIITVTSPHNLHSQLRPYWAFLALTGPTTTGGAVQEEMVLEGVTPSLIDHAPTFIMSSLVQSISPGHSSGPQGVSSSPLPQAMRGASVIAWVESSEVKKSTLGVVALEIPLVEVEDVWGGAVHSSVHAFLMNADDGTAVVHPRLSRVYERRATMRMNE